MAVDKLVDSTQLDSDLASVANAIRAKSGGSGQLAFPAGFVSEIQAIPSGGGGITIGPTSYPVKIKNASSANRASGRVIYNSTVLLAENTETISAGTTKTYSDLATDGDHIWIRMNNLTTVKYNEATADFKRSGNYFQITIPPGFDGTIAFEFS